MLRKKESSKIDKAVATSVDYEVTLAELTKRSERRAWFVAFAAILLAVILACSYFLVLPLKERTPFLVMADAYTGTATVARLRGDFRSNSITTNEAINRSNLAHFVRARESYDIVQRDIRDWNIVFTMSAPTVSEAYRRDVYNTKNPDSTFNRYGRNKAIQVNIMSIQLLDGSSNRGAPGQGGGDATVRFQRILVDRTSGSRSVLDSQIANIRYNYNRNLAFNDELRWNNPLGFQVTSYRVDREYISMPVQPPLPAGQTGSQPTPAVPAQQPAVSADGATAPPVDGGAVPQAVPGQIDPPQVTAPATTNTNGANTQ